MASFPNNLEIDENNVLHSSLSTAFSPTSVPLQPTAQPSQPKTAESNALDLPPLPESKAGESSSSTDDWKSEYESQVQTWRAQSAEAREKAEKERNRWEGIREAEKRDAEQRKAEGKSVHVEGHETGWETVSQGQASHTTSSGRILTPSPVDARELVPGEIPRDFSKNGPPASKSAERPTRKPERHDTEKWEDIPSLTSSFPSTSFPERSSRTSPELGTRNRQSAEDPPTIPAKAPLSATLAIFDSSLPAGARVSALFASLAINMLLPFVNGVMLGFGEIFAKNVVLGWFGWKSGASVATNIGVGVPRPTERRQRGPN